ncbi:TPA: hypothetical protein PF400_002566 [Staphylococcus aureus]|nr:hypothetical protein [Staphylococcus aureus]MCR0868892.1 hypothetical protein [Staphylococcus aureus]HDG5853146.1 hypothetical protein [Staphylococcus aureus]HEB5851348.1 hypothetical protein [Staphylococcus aureus]
MDLQKIKLLSCAFVGFTFFNMSTVHASEQYPSRTAGFEYTRGHSPYDTSYQYESGTSVSSNQYPSRTAGFEYTRGHSPYDTSYQYEKGTLAYSLNELYNILKSRALIHSDK